MYMCALHRCHDLVCGRITFSSFWISFWTLAAILVVGAVSVSEIVCRGDDRISTVPLPLCNLTLDSQYYSCDHSVMTAFLIRRPHQRLSMWSTNSLYLLNRCQSATGGRRCRLDRVAVAIVALAIALEFGSLSYGLFVLRWHDRRVRVDAQWWMSTSSNSLNRPTATVYRMYSR